MASSTFKQIIRLFLKLLLITFLILVCDWSLGTILKRFYIHQDSGFGYLTTYAIDSTTADVLIFGSSRANHNYVPEIFKDSLHLISYNTGRDGNYVLYTYAIFKAITRRYSPKMVIIDIRPGDINYDKTEYERLSILLPYYQTHPEIRPIIELRGPFEKIKLFSHIYPYNSLIFQIGMGNLESSKSKIQVINGYIPLFKTIQDSKIDTTHYTTCNIDENKIWALNDIISTCKQKGIDLVFVYSPIRIIIHDTFYNSISGLCTENGIRYIDMSNDPFFLNNHNYFADYDHLNDKGARLFSALLVNKIR